MGENAAGNGELPGANVEFDKGFSLGSGAYNGLVVDRLHVTAIDNHTGAPSTLVSRGGAGCSGSPRQQPHDIGIKMGPDAVDHIIGDDRAGEVMDEQKQSREAHQHQSGTDCDRQVGAPRLPAVGAAQDQQQINYGRIEQSERDCVRRSAMKLRISRGPSCCAASVSTTILIEMASVAM